MKLGQWIKNIIKIQPGKPVHLAIPLTRPVAFSLIIIALCIIGWAFCMGWMVGAGQNPETGFAKITGFSAQQDKPITNDNPEPPQSETAEELNHPTDNPDTAANFQRPAGEQLDAWQNSSPARTRAPAVPDPPAKNLQKPQKRQPEAKPRKQELYNFTYQVAAFKTSQEANRLIADLKKAGLRPAMKKSGKVFLVLISLRGSDADARALAGKLAAMKLGKPLQLARKPVSERGKK